MNGLTNGYHLIGFHKRNLQSIRLNINDSARIEWDEDDIYMFCRDTDNSIYIPLNDTERDYDVDTNTFNFNMALN
jgi:hypothetical protein